MLTAAVILLVTAATIVGVWIAGWIDAVHTARNAADLAALAGASAHVADRDPCAEAARVARANRGALVSCAVSGTLSAFAVTVRVSVALRPRVPGGQATVGAEAVAGAGMR